MESLYDGGTQVVHVCIIVLVCGVKLPPLTLNTNVIHSLFPYDLVLALATAADVCNI
jgi:hypothetical protein